MNKRSPIWARIIAIPIVAVGAGNSLAQSITTSGVFVQTSTLVQTDGLIDAFDSLQGQYGGANAGKATALTTNAVTAATVDVRTGGLISGDIHIGVGTDAATVLSLQTKGVVTGTVTTQTSAFQMPTINVPPDADFPPMAGNVWYKDGAVNSLSTDLYCASLRISGNTELRIVGNVRILVDTSLTVETGGRIVVPVNGSLDIYVRGNATVKTTATWSESSKTRLWKVGAGTVKFETGGSFYGSVIAPQATFQLKTDAVLYGSAFANSLLVETGARIHVDKAIELPNLTPPTVHGLRD